MAVLKVLVLLAVTAVIVNVAIAKSYTVGGSNGGWDTSTDLTTWAAAKTFLKGDTLVFQYQAMHSVLEVTKADFDACDTSNPLQGDTSGITTIPLKSAGKRYFICGSVGHCSLGMKIEVETLAATSPAPPTPVATPPPVKTIPPPVTHSTPPPVKTIPAPVTHSTPPQKKTTPARKPHPRHVTLVSSPETAPAVSPSPAKPPVTSPTTYPDVPSSVSPASSPSPNGSLSAPSKSSATKAQNLLGSAVGLSFAMVMMLIL